MGVAGQQQMWLTTCYYRRQRQLWRPSCTVEDARSVFPAHPRSSQLTTTAHVHYITGHSYRPLCPCTRSIGRLTRLKDLTLTHLLPVVAVHKSNSSLAQISSVINCCNLLMLEDAD